MGFILSFLFSIKFVLKIKGIPSIKEIIISIKPEKIPVFDIFICVDKIESS